MSKEFIVSEGDCISSIAFNHGFHPATLWNHPRNRDLRQNRANGTVLKTGDVVFIPDREIKEVSKPTEAEHVFLLKAVPEMLRLRFLDDEGKPRANRRYILTIDGKRRDGKTDGDGFLKAPIPPNAARANLIFFENDTTQETYNLSLGYLQPITEPAGIQARLRHLGYSCGGEQGEIGELTRAAIKSFQTDNDLEATGESEDRTQSKLQELYGA